MFTGKLYPYQEEAVSAIKDANVMLAFDTGTGKTVSAIAAIEKLRGYGHIPRTGVVVVPSSLKYQWQREIHRFTDRVAVVVDGTPTKREATYQIPCDYLIMSYDIFVRDWAKHKNHNAFLVADEASALRGFDTKRCRHFKKVRGSYPIRIALTATPIENGKAEEIFSVLEWLDPKILGPFWSFEKRYIRRNYMGWIEGYKNLGDFHGIIKPYVLRRSHKDPEVAKFLPKVVHKEPYLVELDRATRKIYDFIGSSVLADLDEYVNAISFQAMPDDEQILEDHPDGKMMAKIQAMRMLLDHPSAVVLSASAVETGRGSKFCQDLVSNHGAGDLSTTPKMDALEQYVMDFLAASPDHKVVIFCSFVKVADSIVFRIPDSVQFTGRMTAKERDRAKQKFASDPGCRVFVATDAGGYGLDLPEANLLINFDLPWAAGMLQQRNGRIRRASSKWGHVTIQDFVVKDTIEERMLDMLMHKIAVSTAIVDGEGITDSGTVASDLDSLRSFLQALEEMKVSA